MLRTERLDKAKASMLSKMMLETETFDFWQDPRPGQSADIRVSPELLADLEDFLSQHEIKFETMIEDVEK